MNGPSDSQFESCPAENELLKVLDDSLDPQRLNNIEDHLGQCERCRTKLEELAGGSQWITSDKPISGDYEVLSPKKNSGHGVHGGLTEDQSLFTHLLLAAEYEGDLGILDGFRIHNVIDRGAMGIVFKATDPSLNRLVAIKLIDPVLAADPDFRVRFMREARAAAALNHPSIVTVFRVGEFQNLPYIVMEYVDGFSLEMMLQFGAPLPNHRILQIGQEICLGLQAAHNQNIIHRDIKPANILIRRNDLSVRIADFGLAQPLGDQRITRSRHIVGSPAYMSPEQARERELTPSSDLFSLGSVLYTMATGRLPFLAPSSLETLTMVVEATPPPPETFNPDLNPGISSLIAKLMTKKPDERFESAEAVRQEIKNLCHHSDHWNTFPTKSGSRRTPKRWSTILIPAVILAVAFGSGWFLSKAITSDFWSDKSTANLQDEVNSQTDTFSGLPRIERQITRVVTAENPQFSVLSNAEKFSDLNEAIEASGDFDTIELSFNGLLRMTPVHIGAGKNLILKAAPGTNPVLTSSADSEAATASRKTVEPIISTKSGLIIEGIEFLAPDAANSVVFHPLIKCAGPWFYGLNLTLSSSNVAASGHGTVPNSPNQDISSLIEWSPSGTIGRFVLRNSILRNPNGRCLAFDSRHMNSSPEISMENCRILGHSAIAGTIGPQQNVIIKSLRSHSLANHFAHLEFQNIEDSSIDCRFDFSVIDGLRIISIASLPPESQSDSDTIPVFRPSILSWTGHANVFLTRNAPVEVSTSMIPDAAVRSYSRFQWIELNRAGNRFQLYPEVFTGQLHERVQFLHRQNRFQAPWTNQMKYSDLELSMLIEGDIELAEPLSVSDRRELLKDSPLNQDGIQAGAEYYHDFTYTNYYGSWVKSLAPLLAEDH